MRSLLSGSCDWCVLMACAGALLFAGHLGAADPVLPQPVAEETWQVIYLAGQRVGYARSLVSPLESDGETLVRTEVETHLSIKRFGQTLNMSTSQESVETLAGNMLRYAFEMKNPPASTTKNTGEVDGAKLRISSDINGRKSQSVTEWKPGIKSPTYQDRLLRAQPLKAGEQKQFDVFFPEMSKPGTLKVVAGDSESIEVLGGKRETLQKVTVTNSIIPGVKTLAWINARGDTVKSSTSMLGTEMVTYTVPKDEALKVLTVTELDLGLSTLVKTKAIPNPYQTRKVVYRITIPDENPTQVIPAGDTQSVAEVSEHVADVTVAQLPIPASATIGKVAAEFLEPTQFLQSDDDKVKEHAERAAGTLTDPAAIAKAMESYVRTNLKNKNFSTALASAGEVARNLEGDCTEHAVLLAAMLRAKGIPSRVAVGLVYIEGPSAFGGHMWTEARLNDQWVPIDGTLGRGGIGATHIKLGDATFADANGAPLATFTSLITVIGKLQIEVREVN